MSKGTETLTRGQFARFTEDHDRHRKGDTFEVLSYFEGFQPGDAEHGDPDYIQGPIIEGFSGNGSTVEVPASVVEPALDNEGEPVSALPHISAIVEAVSSALHTIQFDGDFDVTETGIDGQRIEVSATSVDSGVDFGFVVMVAEVSR